MKKVLFFSIILAVLAIGCKKKSASDDKSTSLNYNDSDPIVMALCGKTNYFDRQIDVTSDYDITYTAINPDSIDVITVSSAGKIHGKNVGEARLKLDNGYEKKTVDVKVDLFIEPTFEFGCGTSRIRKLYGKPYQSAIVDTFLVYRYTRTKGYSYACGEMDFFFHNGAYIEADLYIRKFPPDDYLLNNYLNERFDHYSTLGDTLDIYRLKQDTTIYCGKFDSNNQWNEWCLFYAKDDDGKALDKSLKIRPRSSKLRY